MCTEEIFCVQGRCKPHLDAHSPSADDGEERRQKPRALLKLLQALLAVRTLHECYMEDAALREAMASGQVDQLYKIDDKLLRELRPDVILTQDICSVCAIDLQTVERVAAELGGLRCCQQPRVQVYLTTNHSTSNVCGAEWSKVGR